MQRGVEKSISNEIVLEWSSQESNGWETPEDAVSFCQKVKEDVLMCFDKTGFLGNERLSASMARESLQCATKHSGLWTSWYDSLILDNHVFYSSRAINMAFPSSLWGVCPVTGLLSPRYSSVPHFFCSTRDHPYCLHNSPSSFLVLS